MPGERITVGLVGATGETGSSVVDGLLEADKFNLIALTRPSSLTKPTTQALQSRGLTLRSIDLTASVDSIATSLTGIQILISTLDPLSLNSQLPLASAAKLANVSRFIPCAFGPITAPGSTFLANCKRLIVDHIQQIRVPYTVIEVGWWYQISIPRLPSGRSDAVQLSSGPSTIYGPGNVQSGYTDKRDIGRYVARIIADPRTLNAHVFVYNELLTQEQVWSMVERLSGEKIPRAYLSLADLQAKLQGVESKELNRESLMKRVPVEYQISWGVRGDNQPEYARYLGFLLGKELYPDFESRSLENYVKEVLEGKAEGVYRGRYSDLKK